jgi:hypothetical protein
MNFSSLGCKFKLKFALPEILNYGVSNSPGFTVFKNAVFIIICLLYYLFVCQFCCCCGPLRPTGNALLCFAIITSVAILPAKILFNV